MNDKMSFFAESVFKQKYSHDNETWEDTVNRVVKTVFKAVNGHKDLIAQVQQFMLARKFLPGGRYLYATGQPFHMISNCFLLRAEDSREGWADLLYKNS